MKHTDILNNINSFPKVSAFNFLSALNSILNFRLLLTVARGIITQNVCH